MVTIVLMGLMVACSSEVEEGALPAVPITFSCGEGETAGTYGTNETYGSRGVNGQTGYVSDVNGHLLYSGFGVFAKEEGAELFDFMSNQKVEFTFLANDPKSLYDGYWSYQPLKYWPYKYNGTKNVPKTLTFCAYAPYVERPADDFKNDPENKGIIGMSANNDAIPYILYARGKQLDECVDLLWCCEEADNAEKGVTLKMNHALARISVKMTLTAVAGDIEKVLIERVSLTGSIARKGKLHLTSHETATVGTETFRYPTWEVKDGDKENATIVIDCDPKQYHIDNPLHETYGIIAESVRYVKGLPKDWQPKGLEKDKTVNILTQDDDQYVYLLLIPQNPLNLTAQIQLQVYRGDNTEPESVTRNSAEFRVGEPADAADEDKTLYGNRPYNLELKISL